MDLIPGGKAIKGLRHGATWARNLYRGRAVERIAVNAAKLRHPLSQVRMARGAGSGVRTPYGYRYPDIQVRSRLTGRITFIEVKAGRSPYTRPQMAKDSFIRRTTGIRTKVWRCGRC